MTIVSPYTLINGPGYVASGQAAGAITPTQVQALASSLAGIASSGQTASYTIALTDVGTCIEVSVTAPNTAIVFIPTDASVLFDSGTVVEVCQTGTGTVGIAAVTPGTTTIQSPTGTYTTTGLYSTVAMRKRSANTWLLSGDLIASNLVPIQANYMPGQDLSQSYWTKTGLTITGTDAAKETATNAQHALSNTSTLTRAAGTVTYQMFADITPATTGWCELIVYDGTFTDFIACWINVVGMAVTTPSLGTWTSGSSWVLPMGGSKVRCGVQFTSDASTTNFNCQFNLGTSNGGTPYLGVVSNGQTFDNLWLYNVNAGAGGL